jgi:hypothetical protein
MKKIMMMVAMMAVAFTANAQYEPGSVSIQPKVGVSVSKLTNMPSIDLGLTKTTVDPAFLGGLHFGAEFEYQVSNAFSLAAAVNYTQQGSAWDDLEVRADEGSFKMSDFKIQTGYITIPVVANIYVAKGLALKGGVQCAFLTDAKFKGKMELSAPGSVGVNEDLDMDCKDGMNSFDLSIPVGMSYEFNNNLVLDARYHIGLSDVNKDADPGEKSVKNSVFLLTLGYKLKL